MQDIRKEFFATIAKQLILRAPDQAEQDDLTFTIMGAHAHAQAYGHIMKGKKLEGKSLNENLDEKHRWIIPIIEECQHA